MSEFGYDDRKTLLDVYYDAGGKVGDELDLHADIYPGLIAVANHGWALAKEDENRNDAEPKNPKKVVNPS